MADNKQQRIEYMVQRFQELVSKHDILASSHLELMKSLQILSGMIIPFQKDLELLKKSQEFLKVHLDSNKQEQSNLWNISGNISDKLSKRIDDVNIKFQGESIKHDQHVKDFQFIKDELSKKVSLNNHVESYSALKSRLEELRNDHFLMITTLQNSLKKSYEKHAIVDVVKDEQGKQFNEMKSIKDLFLEVEKQCKSALHEHKQKIDRDLLTIASETQKKIESLPKSEKPDLSSVKQDVNKQIEPAFLDAKNANLRSSNNEIKINILEKKLEQLQLMMNKLQLQE